MLPDKKVKCPYTGFSKTCSEGVIEHSCPKWVKLVGKDPQTGGMVDKYDCADAWVPLLLIENANMSRGTTIAIEKFRDETLKAGVAAEQTKREALERLTGGNAGQLKVIK